MYYNLARNHKTLRVSAANSGPENKVSLGFVEGLNNKIRVIRRRTDGLRDEKYLRLKIPPYVLSEL